MDDDNVEQVVEEVHEPVDPLLQLKQLAFDWESGLAGDRDKIKQEIIEAVKSENREPYYSHLCEKLGWAKDEKLVAEMVKANTEAMAKLEEKKKDAEDNLGETEVHDCELEMVAHLHKIGDKDACVKKIDEMLEKVPSLHTQERNATVGAPEVQVQMSRHRCVAQTTTGPWALKMRGHASAGHLSALVSWFASLQFFFVRQHCLKPTCPLHSLDITCSVAGTPPPPFQPQETVTCQSQRKHISPTWWLFCTLCWCYFVMFIFYRTRP